jgi:hypothetical protein
MSHCRICTGPTVAIGPDDHETVCGNCIDEAVLDAYLSDLPDEPVIREQVTRAFYMARRTDNETRLSIDALTIDGKELPLPDDLLVDELIELLADETNEIRIERIEAPNDAPNDVLNNTPVLRPSAAWLTSQHPALRGELHRPFLPVDLNNRDEPDAPDDGRPLCFEAEPLHDEYPGYRHFRVLEATERNGERSWTIRDVYRRG